MAWSSGSSTSSNDEPPKSGSKISLVASPLLVLATTHSPLKAGLVLAEHPGTTAPLLTLAGWQLTLAFCATATRSLRTGADLRRGPTPNAS